MAEKRIGASLNLDGEKQFKQAISEINKDMNILGSEMKKVTAEFSDNSNSIESLTAKSNVYNKQIDEQKKKIGTLKTALENSSKEYGENDAKTKNWQVSLAKAEAELAQTERSLRKTTKEMDQLGNAADDNGGKFEKLGDTLKVSAAAMGAIAAAAGAAAFALGKAVVGAYADYEQLVGGVDTLFKDSSNKVQDYANNAFKTAGLSANEYMETVTSFSASLIQSLGGDTEKASKYADRAITDMADNANKMGSDMASIQNAYQGFAKQNYTMLDNLKLGYGGTKTEMERLLTDAGKIAGVKFDITSYADVTEAIHVMQENMGIAGTTALEAEKTISGSISAMGGAWENLLIGFGNSDADMQELTSNLIGAFQNVVSNVTPIIKNLTDALPQAVDTILSALGDLLPTLLDTVVSLFQQVLDTVLKILPNLIPVVVKALLTIVDTLIENLPLIIEGAFTLIMALAEGMIDALPKLIPAIVDTVLMIVETLIDNIDMLIDASIAIILALAEGLIDALPKLIDKIPVIIDKLIVAIIENLPLLVEAGIQIIVAVAGGLIKAIPHVIKAIPEIIKAIVNAFDTAKNTITDIGRNIVYGIWDGIKAMADWFKNQISGFFGGIVRNVKGVLGIQSPSKVFAEIGGYMADGLGQGFEKEMQNVAGQINNSIPTNVTVTGQVARMGEGIVNGLAGVMGNQPDTIIQVVLDGKVLAQTLYNPLNGVIKQRGVVLG